MAKIKYGFKNVYYAPITAWDAETGAPTYGTPVKWPGGVSLNMDPQGDNTPFYADNIIYYMGAANNGYQGDLEMALAVDSFKKDILGFVSDSNEVMIEDVNAETKHFALLFQFEHDEKASRHVLYNCTATRPSVAGTTKGESIEPETETCTITATSIYNATLDKDIVKATANGGSDATAYSSWFNAVYLPAGE